MTITPHGLPAHSRGESEAARPPADTLDPRLVRVVGWLFVLALVCAVLAKGVEWAAFGDLTFWLDPWSLLGLFAAQWLFDSNRQVVAGVLVVAAVVSSLQVYYYPGAGLHGPALVLGVVTFLGLAGRLLLVPGDRRAAAFMLAAGLLLPVSHQICVTSQRLTTLRQETFDLRVYLVDLSLGFNPSVLAAPLMERIPAGAVLRITYGSIPFVMAVLILCRLRRDPPDGLVALAALVLAGVVGSLLYHVFPVAGPRYAFADTWPAPPTDGLSPAAAFLNLAYVRNGVPSLHTAWALLVYLNTAGLSLGWRAAAGAFCLFTLLATLATGEHYLMDLVVALPFALAVQAAARRLKDANGTLPALAFGTCATILWLVLLRTRAELFLTVPGFTRAAVLVTLAGGALVMRPLSRNAVDHQTMRIDAAKL